MSETEPNNYSTSIFHFIHKWRHVLITISVLAIVTSLVFSFFIEDKYSSSVILFPTTTSSISRALLNNESYSEKDFLAFGEEAEADQMLQILNSNDIKHHIIKKYDLYTHYDIDQESKYRYTELSDIYEDNIDFFRTKYLAVKIEVLDKDPQYASSIANEIAFMLDSIKGKMQKKVALQAYQIVKKEFDLLKKQISQMEDTLNQIRKKGVQDYETQVEVLTEQYGAALVSNNQNAANTINDRLDTLSKYGGQYLSLSNQLEFERSKFSDLRVKLSEARVNAFSNLDQKFIVNDAQPAEKPSYPIRWLIVVVFSLIAFLFTLILLILIDYKR